MVYRIYVERKSGFREKAEAFAAEARELLGIGELRGVRLLNRYDVEGISRELFLQCVPTVFSEPQTDEATEEAPAPPKPGEGAMFAVEYLPGQFDQRAESASECIQLVSQGERPVVRSATVYILQGALTPAQVEAVKHYVINPVEAREADLAPRTTLAMEFARPADVERIEGFDALDDAGLSRFIAERGLAMDLADARMVQAYFAEEGRAPSITEVKMIDTYWSDHCRHTTFGTVLERMEIDDAQVQEAYENYLACRHELGRDEKPICLMDMGTIAAKQLRARGILRNLDESDEVNACTVRCKADVDGQEQDWLYLFKNETHNHPTEIEPFGGAATCVGGAIRDPLSGRAYVYQAMRVTGAADPFTPVSETLAGKLPQRKIVTAAAEGYSSYGNQIGLATGQVSELYHPGYVAKRMEIGAVVGAAPAENVRREEPAPGDVVILLGGRTGRDGIGGATGSSKAHTLGSLESCGAEVQKGNPPVERKIQRLFRRGEACRMIKRCNDFGAGGVSVAIGELAAGLSIDLDAVPRKYDGLDGTELAISESQERMAVALAAEDADAFIALAHEENLEAVVVAHVTDDARIRMTWRGDVVVDVSRAFLDTNGAPKHAAVHIAPGADWRGDWPGKTLEERMGALVRDLNVASNKGLAERFDSTIGAASVLMPFGGKYQLTPALAMACKLPVEGETTTCSGMAWGFNPYLSSANQYRGAYAAVVESVCRLVAAGFRRKDAYLTLQEYFEKLGDDADRWGKPAGAVLGAFQAQLDLEVGAIGGKDSMSGSFEDLDVPPTLVSFATAVGPVGRVQSPEFKRAGSPVLLLSPAYQEDGVLPDADSLKAVIACVERLIEENLALAVSTPGYGGLAEALFKQCVGNRIGFRSLGEAGDVLPADLFAPAYGSFVVELADAAGVELAQAAAQDGAFTAVRAGATSEEYLFAAQGEVVNLALLQTAWEQRMEPIFPYRSAPGQDGGEAVEAISSDAPTTRRASDFRTPRPKVAIPVFPGTNCEYDSARAFRLAGANPQVLVVNNLSPQAVAESTDALASLIRESQIVFLPGGFSGGDEPDGSAKFITAFFRAPQVTEAVRELLQRRDGLMLGICNGFQALVKLGLVPFGDIVDMDFTCPTLTFNKIGRHQSRLVRTRVASVKSPWLASCSVGDIHMVPVSHGEGRFVSPEDVLSAIKDAGQVATQYVDAEGVPGMGLDVNPNGSVLAIEGVTSPDGRVLGKMGHSERFGQGLYKNVPDAVPQPLFENGVAYFA